MNGQIFQIQPKKISFLDLAILKFLPIQISSDTDGVIETTIYYQTLHGKIYIIKEEVKYL